MSPGQEVVDPRSGMDGGDALEGCRVVGVGLDAIRFCRFGERSDPAPGGRPFVLARERCVSLRSGKSVRSVCPYRAGLRGPLSLARPFRSTTGR